MVFLFLLGLFDKTTINKSIGDTYGHFFFFNIPLKTTHTYSKMTNKYYFLFYLYFYFKKYIYIMLNDIKKMQNLINKFGILIIIFIFLVYFLIKLCFY